MNDASDVTAKTLAESADTETESVPENPTQDELASSLSDAKFPQASHMAEEIFGEEPDRGNDEKNSD